MRSAAAGRGFGFFRPVQQCLRSASEARRGFDIIRSRSAASIQASSPSVSTFFATEEGIWINFDEFWFLPTFSTETPERCFDRGLGKRQRPKVFSGRDGPFLRCGSPPSRSRVRLVCDVYVEMLHHCIPRVCFILSKASERTSFYRAYHTIRAASRTRKKGVFGRDAPRDDIGILTDIEKC